MDTTDTSILFFMQMLQVTMSLLLFSHQKTQKPKLLVSVSLWMFSTCPWNYHENIKVVFQLLCQSQMSADPTVRLN